nr:MAG TPA: tail protein [Bacteriophage sp.]
MAAKMNKYQTAQPSTRTTFEKKFGEAEIYTVPYAVVSGLWNPDRIPAHLLPYLAWALSVDYWNDTWDEQRKRDVIKSAYRTHKYKGTNGAIEEALKPFGVTAKITEWFQTKPIGSPASFGLNLMAEEAISQADYQEMLRIVQKVKPVSRHLSGLTIGVITSGKLKASGITISGQRTTIYPYIKPKINLKPAGRAAAALQQIDVITINPKANP